MSLFSINDPEMGTRWKLSHVCLKLFRVEVGSPDCDYGWLRLDMEARRAIGKQVRTREEERTRNLREADGGAESHH